MNHSSNFQGGDTANLVGVKFRRAGRIQRADAGQLTLCAGDHVVVRTEHGNLLGTVTALPRPTSPDESAALPRVVKKADAGDIERQDHNHVREREAVRACLRSVRERHLQLKLIKAEQVFDGGKIIFYFTADGRVDFRELVRDLAHTLHMRIEMKQIGPRDETALVGAGGPCGREVCCATWLREPGGVSVKMAKTQGLSLNPSKLAGMCGRLKCCLRYEYDTYVTLARQLPAIGHQVVSVKGDGVVTRQHVLRQTVTIRRDDGGEVEATLEDLVEKRAQ